MSARDLRSLGNHDTHHKRIRNDGTVPAVCGAAFRPWPTLRVRVIDSLPDELATRSPRRGVAHRTRIRSAGNARLAGTTGQGPAPRGPAVSR